MSVTSFHEIHRRNGLVSNQDRHMAGWGFKPPFASVICCGEAYCVEKAIAYVQGTTGEPARYQEDA